MRDSVAHPKLYIVKQLMKPDYSFTEQKAKLAAGAKHRPKTLARKLKRSERTAFLRLPLVATWISYVDMVLCVLVVNRFLNLLQEKYGNYAWLGSSSVQNIPPNFFYGWGSTTRKSVLLEEWAQAFFNSLAPADRQSVEKRLRTTPSKYIKKRVKYPRIIKRASKGGIQYELQDAPNTGVSSKAPTVENASLERPVNTYGLPSSRDLSAIRPNIASTTSGSDLSSLGEGTGNAAFFAITLPVSLAMTSGRVWAHSFVTNAEHPALVIDSLVTLSSCEEIPTT